MGLFFIIPILAFNLWLSATTGAERIRHWRKSRQHLKLALVFAAGVLLAVWFAFLIRYKMGPSIRVHGFPVPSIFDHIENKHWVRDPLPLWLAIFAFATNILTGLTAPFIPCKIADFLKKVKAEL